MQLSSHRTHEFGQSPLDRHVDVFIVVLEREALLGELALDFPETPQQGVTIIRGDDPPCGEHPRMRTGLREILGPEPAIEVDRRVQTPKVGILGLMKARHCWW